MKSVMEHNETFAKGMEKGVAKGIAEGDRLRQIKIAKTMIAEGFDENRIHHFSELPIEEIRKLY